MCACNCLDDIKEGKIQEVNNDMYQRISTKAELSATCDLVKNYICTQCGPTYLKLIKTEKRAMIPVKNGQVVNLKTEIPQPQLLKIMKPFKIKTIAPKDSLSARLSNGSRPARNTDAKKAGSETLSNIFPFSNHFSGLDGTNSKDRKLEDFKFISDMFISISKTEFAPWTVYLQHGKTGVIAAFFSGIFSRNLGYKKSDTSLLISIWFTIKHFLSSVSTGKTC